MIKNLIRTIKINIFTEMLNEIEWQLKVQRNKYYFRIHKDGKIMENISEITINKWKKLEKYFDMFYSIRMNLNEILELSKIESD